jgi:putative toxin-antitoxin system antitoxin component (TIGR02293 family)
MTEPVSPTRIAASLTELWSPRVVAELDDAYVKVAKVHGTLCWHSHDDEDELFHVLHGRLRIEMEDRSVVLNAGDVFVVPKGVRHNPVAEEECHILLIEKKSTRHTGNEVTERTRSLDEQLRTVNESGRIMRLARVSSLAKNLFGNDQKAHDWLTTPRILVAGEEPISPLALAGSESGAIFVESLLKRVEYGMI